MISRGNSSKSAALRPPTYPDFERHDRAVARVQALLHRVTRALNEAKVDYAVIGGHAVADWVSTIDANAIRNTKDVDLLVRRSDYDRIATTFGPLGLVPAEVNGLSMFLEKEDPAPTRGVHLVFANESIRGSGVLAPDVAGAVQGVLGFQVVPLLDLIKMKLHAYRLRDQTHLVDLMQIGLIDANWKERLPAELQDRYQQVLEAFEREGQQP